MINVVGKRKIWYSLSVIMLIFSISAILFYGFKLAIDFTGGALIQIAFDEKKSEVQNVHKILEKQQLVGSIVQELGEKELLIRTKPLTPEAHDALLKMLSTDLKETFTESRFETIGPTVSKELREKSITMIIVVAMAIILYISWAFRSVSKPVSSWKYGVIAVTALVHDVTMPAGIFALLGHYFGVEIDILFVTAMLTVMGFSVHDTIVVFDRIRESLERNNSTTFEETVNASVNATFARSINTSMTTLIVLFSLFFFGGESVKYFSLVMIIGIIVGTYSSIFIASPLLVSWFYFQNKKK